MKRVLVTGATGFIGRHSLAPLAASGYEVHATSSRPVSERAGGLRWHTADLLDAEAVRRLLAQVHPTHLLCFAWPVPPGDFWEAPHNLQWAEAWADLAAAFAEQGGQRAVFAGSCAEYDWTEGWLREDVTPLAPTTLYGCCKRDAWRGIRDAIADTETTAAWGRIFFLYGPHEPRGRLVSSVTEALLSGQLAACTAGDQRRDFLYVQDVADAFVALLEGEVAGAVNIGSGQAVPVRSVVETLARITGRLELVAFGAMPRAAGEPELIAADATRLREVTGWRPAVSLEEGLRRTVSWWREHGREPQ